MKKKEEYISDNIKSLEAKLSAYNNNINESKQNIEQFANVVENLERNLQHIQEGLNISWKILLFLLLLKLLLLKLLKIIISNQQKFIF